MHLVGFTMESATTTFITNKIAWHLFQQHVLMHYFHANLMHIKCKNQELYKVQDVMCHIME